MSNKSTFKKFITYKPLVIAIVILISATSCKPIKRFMTSEAKLAESYAESLTSYSYVPIDPLPVSTRPGDSCGENNSVCEGSKCYKGLIESFPDQTVRLAITDLNSSLSGSLGPVSVGKKGSTYEVVLDFINVDVAQKFVHVKRVMNDESSSNIPLYSTNNEHLDSRYIIKQVDSTLIDGEGLKRLEDENELYEEKGEIVSIPVYIGIGLRLTATVQVLKGEANLSSLGALSAGVESGKLIGTMTVQTLGITGSKIILPQPSEINQTTIQNALVALGSIRSNLNPDDEGVTLTPRVVGIYNPIGGGKQVINGIITALATRRVIWKRPCDEEKCEN